MASLPKVKRILREDLKDAPSWIDKLIYILNLFMDSVYSALNKNLTFGDNIRAQIKTFQITAGTTADLNIFSFQTSITNPAGVILMNIVDTQGNYTVITSATSIPSWHYISGKLYIDSITGLTDTHVYNITVLVI